MSRGNLAHSTHLAAEPARGPGPFDIVKWAHWRCDITKRGPNPQPSHLEPHQPTIHLVNMRENYT